MALRLVAARTRTAAAVAASTFRQLSSVATAARAEPQTASSRLFNIAGSNGYALCEARTSYPSIPEAIEKYGRKIHVQSFADHYIRDLAQFCIDQHNAKHNVKRELVKVNFANCHKQRCKLYESDFEMVEIDYDDPEFVQLYAYVPTAKDDEYIRLLKGRQNHRNRQVDFYFYYILLVAIEFGVEKEFEAFLWVKCDGSLLQMQQLDYPVILLQHPIKEVVVAKKPSSRESTG